MFKCVVGGVLRIDEACCVLRLCVIFCRLRFSLTASYKSYMPQSKYVTLFSRFFLEELLDCLGWQAHSGSEYPCTCLCPYSGQYEGERTRIEGLDGRVCTFMISESIANLPSKKTSNITVTFRGNRVYLTASSGSVGASLSRSYQLLMLPDFF